MPLQLKKCKDTGSFQLLRHGNENYILNPSSPPGPSTPRLLHNLKPSNFLGRSNKRTSHRTHYSHDTKFMAMTSRRNFVLLPPEIICRELARFLCEKYLIRLAQTCQRMRGLLIDQILSNVRISLNFAKHPSLDKSSAFSNAFNGTPYFALFKSLSVLGFNSSIAYGTIEPTILQLASLSTQFTMHCSTLTTDQAAENLSRVLCRAFANPCLREFELTFEFFDDRRAMVLDEFAKAFARTPCRLTTLSIQFCVACHGPAILPETWVALCKAIERQPALESVILGLPCPDEPSERNYHFQLQTVLLGSLAISACALKELYVDFGTRGPQHSSQAFLALIALFGRNPRVNLQSVTIRHASIPPLAANALTHALTNTPAFRSISELALDFCDLPCASLLQIASAIKSTQTLTSLHLTPLDPPTSALPSAALAASIPSCLALTSLFLGSIVFSDHSLELLASSIAKSSSICHLTVSNTQSCTPHGFATFARMLAASTTTKAVLQTLDLSENHIGKRGWSELEKFVRGCNVLEILDLDGSDLRDGDDPETMEEVEHVYHEKEIEVIRNIEREKRRKMPDFEIWTGMCKVCEDGRAGRECVNKGCAGVESYCKSVFLGGICGLLEGVGISIQLPVH
ncbi:hypothetical protein BJ742DRAFT_867481 [Cladochytrium replicatum]|nr:hypothetical protein BJ742DRAFT_867481 [Cladochytrium replicatum]